MDLTIIDSITEIFNNICSFLFGTYEGIGLLFLGFIIIAFIIAAILERRTKKIFKDHSTDQENITDKQQSDTLSDKSPDNSYEDSPNDKSNKTENE